MKNILPVSVLLFISIFSMHTLRAQEKAFQFGFKLSPSMGWVAPNAEGYERDGLKLGFNWGFVGDIHLMENYVIHTGFNVVYLNGAYTFPHKQTSNDGSGTEIIGDMNRFLRLKYIQIPVVMRMKTNEIKDITYYGEVGLGLAIKTSANADNTFSRNGTIVESTKKVNVSDEYRFSRESLILGVGAYYNLGGSTKLTGGLRFDNNFFNILKGKNTVDTSVDQKAIANFLELSIGVLF
ncbi:MAG: porin family protein [Bacteroidales bacterium]|nr:porin family protein [Bacteroidales bacterium]